ncbi:hypothetical protein GCM10010282_53180 [Streptomyces roseolus]|nr:hypothetical protein GCM10010282_53180 [Streptomyces roseolus]
MPRGPGREAGTRPVFRRPLPGDTGTRAPGAQDTASPAPGFRQRRKADLYADGVVPTCRAK